MAVREQGQKKEDQRFLIRFGEHAALCGLSAHGLKELHAVIGALLGAIEEHPWLEEVALDAWQAPDQNILLELDEPGTIGATVRREEAAKEARAAKRRAARAAKKGTPA